MKNPAPLTRIQNLHDALEEALDRQDTTRTMQLRQQLRTQLAEHALREQTARSLERNGMSQHTRELLRGLGWRVIRLS